jgi:hypothetical protein
VYKDCELEERGETKEKLKEFVRSLLGISDSASKTYHESFIGRFFDSSKISEEKEGCP